MCCFWLTLTEGIKGAGNAETRRCYLEKHEVELTRSEDFLKGDAVGILFHALLLGKREELPGHQTQQVKLLHVGPQVDTDAVSVGNRRAAESVVLFFADQLSARPPSSLL